MMSRTNLQIGIAFFWSLAAGGILAFIILVLTSCASQTVVMGKTVYHGGVLFAKSEVAHMEVRSTDGTVIITGQKLNGEKAAGILGAAYGANLLASVSKNATNSAASVSKVLSNNSVKKAALKNDALKITTDAAVAKEAIKAAP